MEQKQRFFIYDRKEMGILVLLGVLVAVFAFTLGVHLGKRVAPKPLAMQSPTPELATTPDAVPDKYDITEQSKGAPQVVDDSLNQSLHDEVARTGIKLDTTRQVELPSKTRTATAGATTLEKGKGAAQAETAPDSKHAEAETAAAPKEQTLDTIPAAARPSPAGKFTLQIGSFPVLAEAKDHIDSLEALGLKPYLRPAELKTPGSKGKKQRWYRIYVGGYDSKNAAEEAGSRYRSQHLIDTFIVAKIQD